MKLRITILFISILLFSCSKDNDETDRIVNNVNVNTATSSFNSFRIQGISGYPSVEPVTWNDTLSKAAYDYAKAKTEDINIPGSIYYLSNGQFILDFPKSLYYSGNANYALYYAFDASASVETVINAGFTATDPMILNGLMNPDAQQFGMAQYGDKWFVIMAE